MQPNLKKLKPKRRKLPMNPNKVTTPITGSIPSYTWEEIAKNLTQIREDNNPLRRKVATVKEENDMWDKLMPSTEIYDKYQTLKESYESLLESYESLLESCEILERYNKNQRETIIQLQKDSKDLYDVRRQNKNLSADITRLNQDLKNADEEFGILEATYDYLVDKLAQSTREIDRKESLIKDYQGQLKQYADTHGKLSVNSSNMEKLENENKRLIGALDRADRSNNSLKDQLAKLEANQPHPGDVKMGAIIKRAYQDLQAAELEKNLCKPQDYELKKTVWK